jgi:6,7-dimethyl-8-ribityllumazine synthase
MTPSELTGHNDGADLKIGIAIARFNKYVTGMMLAGALARLTELGVAEEDVTVAWVPGSFELPSAALEMAVQPNLAVDAVICLGTVINGETAHFEHVSRGAAEGIARIIFGVLTTYSTDQAVERADTGGQNLGAEYADAAVEMANLRRALRDL